MTTDSPRLTDWLASISLPELRDLRNTLYRCRNGEGDRRQEDDLLHLVRLHHIRETNTEISAEAIDDWIAAFDEVRCLVRQEHHRRTGVNYELMTALFKD